jgi:23S rRNA maturation mini-RNase III
LATTCNKNEQQQNAKNNADLWTEWTKTTWKAFEETIRRDRNTPVKASLRTVDDGDYDYDDYYYYGSVI